ncbi:hypothetical protein QWY26_05660 [Acinetobacter baumannii]|uniref:hypothetical protein n=1 Tax=Acinetobacter baumannii TaxID=470 RepID=UPI001CDB7ABC|nr:hypothetical protein [Acinetobacter baumannii]MCA4445126.1 hypothetical protein [Acinetobacter baumannii]WKA72766.1 hypothetical protein QWY26_05660 [Acinetobacter baumannii]
MDKCREEFEAYFKEHHADSFYSVDVALEMRGDDYIDFLASDLWAIWQHQQAKVDELQHRNQMLNDNIKEQGQKLVYQNEVIETQAEKLLGLRDEKAELQKRVDAALKQIQSNLQYVEQDRRENFEFLQMAMIRAFKELEKTLEVPNARSK